MILISHPSEAAGSSYYLIFLRIFLKRPFGKGLTQPSPLFFSAKLLQVLPAIFTNSSSHYLNCIPIFIFYPLVYHVVNIQISLIIKVNQWYWFMKYYIIYPQLLTKHNFWYSHRNN